MISGDLPCPDSEDELEDSYAVEYSHEPILEPKDPYSFRPLPLRIGTPAFIAEDDVGLSEMPSDSEGNPVLRIPPPLAVG